jgi:hypothetical protein
MFAGDRVGSPLTLVENRDPQAAEVMGRLHARTGGARSSG